MSRCVLVIFPALVLPWLVAGSAQEPARKDADALTIINTNGKELLFQKWKIVQGTRKIAAAPDAVKPADKDDKPAVKWPAGQEYLEFREDNSTGYKEGILTLVPISSVRQADYDEIKKTVAVTVVDVDGKDVMLSGTTKYADINKLIIDATVEAGDQGPSSVRFQGGMTKAMPLIRTFRFPSTGSAPKVSGTGAVITSIDKEKTVFKVQDLQALYRTGGVDRISGQLIFKKDAKIEVAKIVKLRRAPSENKKLISLEYEVHLADGKQVNLLLVKDVFPDNGLPAQFLGLIGKVPTGYKLFPLHTLAEMRKAE